MAWQGSPLAAWRTHCKRPHDALHPNLTAVDVTVVQVMPGEPFRDKSAMRAMRALRRVCRTKFAFQFGHSIIRFFLERTRHSRQLERAGYNGGTTE